MRNDFRINDNVSHHRTSGHSGCSLCLLYNTVGPDCGYHIYRLIKGLSDLDTSLALAAPCPGVRNIRLISFRLQPEPRDQTPGGAMSVKSEQSLQFRHPADINICVIE